MAGRAVAVGREPVGRAGWGRSSGPGRRAERGANAGWASLTGAGRAGTGREDRPGAGGAGRDAVGDVPMLSKLEKLVYHCVLLSSRASPRAS